MNIKYMRGRKPLIVCVTDTEYAAVKNHFSDGERETFQSVVLEHGFFGGHPFTRAAAATRLSLLTTAK